MITARALVAALCLISLRAGSPAVAQTVLPELQDSGRAEIQPETGTEATGESSEVPGAGDAEHTPNPCDLGPRRSDPLLDKARQELFEAVCNSGRWIDHLFGNESYRRHADSTNGRFGIRLVADENEGVDARLTFRANFDLPNLENKVNLFLGREDQETFVTDPEKSLRLIPDFVRNEEDREWLLGVGYRPAGDTFKGPDFDVGVEVRTPLEPYIRSRYRHLWLIGQRSLARAEQAIYWRNQRGFGTSIGADLERAVRKDLLLRWGNQVVLDQSTDGVSWRTGLTLFQMVNDDRAVAYLVAADGEADADVPVHAWGTRITVRQRMLREWFFGEILGGVAFVREHAGEPREPSFYVGLGFELQFGSGR